MSEATLLLEAPKVVPRTPSPVECSRGHPNDPYPENGKCVVCQVYLPDNKEGFKSEDMAEINKRKAEGGKTREEIAHGVLEDEGVPWDEATEGMRQLALLFAKSKNTKTYELILQQIGVLKAKPKPGEEQTELKYEVSLSAGNVEDLRRSLSDLNEALRID